MKKNFWFVGTLVFFLIIMVMGALMSFAGVLGIVWKIFIVGAALVFAIVMFGYLYGLIDQLLVNKIRNTKKREENAAYLALGVALILAVAAFFGGKYLGDIQFFTIDKMTATIVTFLNYLGTGPVLAILLGILFVPLFIRKLCTLPGNPKLINAIHALIIVIGIIATIPVYRIARYPKFFAEPKAEETCIFCDNWASGGYALAKKNAEPIYLCADHFEQAKQSDSIDPNKDEFGNSKINVFSTAKDVVSQYLKAPSSAKFCSQSQAEIMRMGSTWTIKGWVDAQNSFGATLRNTFTVQITYTAEDTYIVNSCKFN